MAALKDPRGRKKGYMFVAIPVSWLEERPMAQIPHLAMGVYLRLYLMAAGFNNSGALADFRGALDEKDIAFLLRCNQSELHEAMELLEYCSLLEHDGNSWRIPSFTDEQINLDERREQWRKAKALQQQKKNDSKQDVRPELNVYEEVNTEEVSEADVEIDREPDPDTDTEVEKDLIAEPEKDLIAEVEVEAEVEIIQGIPEESSGKPAAAADNSLIASARAALFQDLYREVRKDYKTEDVLAGIDAMVTIAFLHNQWSTDKWDHYNTEMAIELCDPVRRQARLEREKAVYEKKLRMREWRARWEV